MDKTQLLLIGVLAVLLTGFGLTINTINRPIQLSEPIVVQSDPASVIYGGTAEETRWGTTTYATTVVIGVNQGSTTLALASDNSIRYRRIQNTGVALVTCYLGNATSDLVAGRGILLATNTTLGPGETTWEQELGYWGAIRCITSLGTSTISVLQY